MPRGLEYLTQLDQILIKQKKELLEIITDFETANKYKIFNSMGQQIFHAAEQSNCCARQFLGPCPGFSMKIEDNFDNEVIQMERAGCRCKIPIVCACVASVLFCCMVPMWCCHLCGDYCLQEINVS